ncbi:UNVERIFIED_CONTAM: hypothetical protein Scaly_1615700 [Sesamum calycinum]|uniref:Uncharacterized protein n=1 Tax=Sesamum calycinum TaxID=2727403 RepID=A0AAW2PAQ5_9LAMI
MQEKGKNGIGLILQNGTCNPSQPTIKASLQSKEKWHDTDMAIALWFYNSCIPLNACNSPFFQIAMSKFASIGHGYTVPSYHALRVSLSKDAKNQVALIVDSFQKLLSGLLDYIDIRVDTGGNKAYNEISLYRDRQKSFARSTAMTIARSTRPGSIYFETNNVEPIAEADVEQFGRQSRNTYYSDNENADD